MSIEICQHEHQRYIDDFAIICFTIHHKLARICHQKYTTLSASSSSFIWPSSLALFRRWNIFAKWTTGEWTYHGWWCVTEFTILFKGATGCISINMWYFGVLYSTNFMLLKLHSPILYRNDRGYTSTHTYYECVSNTHVVDVCVTISVTKKWKILLHAEYMSRRMLIHLFFFTPVLFCHLLMAIFIL